MWSESHSVLSDSLQPHELYIPWNSPGQNTGVGSLSLLQGSSQPRNQTGVSCIAGRFFTNWAIREAPCVCIPILNYPVVGVCRHTHTHIHIHIYQFSSVAQSCLTLLRPHGLQHARLPCPSPTPGAYSNLCPLSRWCHPTISSSVVPFFSCPQSLLASESFPVSQLFQWGGQSIGVSVLASVLPKNTQDWFSWGWTGWISLQSKGLSRVFSNTTVEKHQFFGAQLSL